MPNPTVPAAQRRLQSTLAALAGPADAAPQTAEPQPDSGVPGPLVRLKAEQVRSFVVDGYLVVRPDELGAGFHEELYERTCDLKGWRTEQQRGGASGPDGEASPAWEGLPEISDLVQSPTVQGALSSLLGDDCVMHPHRALHTSNSFRDQNFHKDGHHIPVRDHRPKWMMGMYYPGEVTLEMGPTCVVGGSQYYEVDRLAWNTLGTGMDPPLSDADPHATSWGDASGRDSRVMNGSDPDARDELLDRTASFFEGREQTKLVVPAGSIVLIHFDILHRGHRQAFEKLGDPESPLPDGIATPDKTIPFRPMFKLQFFRTSQPAPANETPEDAAADEADMAAAFEASGASPGQQSIWRANYRWLRGLPSQAAADESIQVDTKLASLAAELTGGETEPIRVGAAYQLAELARAGEGGAVGVLCQTLASGAQATGLRGIHGSAEHLMRAASYGLGAAGPTAVAPLLEMLEQTVWEDGSSASCARRILHALGDAAEQPTAADVVAVEAAYEQCCVELERYVATLTDWPMFGGRRMEEAEAGGSIFGATTLAEVDALPDQAKSLRYTGTAGVIQSEPADEYGAELHMVAATAMQCLSAWAETVATADDAAVAGAMAPVLMRCILGPEPGYQFEARHGTHAREVAAQAVLKLTSGTKALSGFMPVHPTASNGAMHSTFVTALVALAFKRMGEASGIETAVKTRLASVMVEHDFETRVTAE